MNAGDHVPGGSTTAGYGLWALSLAGRPADETTTAIVTYLLKIQGTARLEGRQPTELKRLQDARWTTSCRRPPLQGSDIADTVLALIGMKNYATTEQQPAVARARMAAEKWLTQAPLKTQEDRIWRLWGLHHLEGDGEARRATIAAIASAQREDGGWAQTDDRASDAFSTGETLFVLCRTGMSADDSMIGRARDYLLRTQLADGSWLVESHVKNKAQPYFENGDPHGEHQFLSTAATAWATAALAQLRPAK
jgi:N-acyl-D-amino-acid deacylase